MNQRGKRSAYHKAYDADHRPERRVKNVAYHAAHRAVILARSRARYAVKREADLARHKAWSLAHPQEMRARTKAAYEAIPREERRSRTKAFNVKYAGKRRAWREQHKERLAKQAAVWALANPGLKRAATARRLARKLRATPAWADLAAINSVYEAAARLTRETGVPHEVDHIVPLRSPIVCGLHVAHNLQILTKTANRRKWNRLQAA